MVLIGKEEEDDYINASYIDVSSSLRTMYPCPTRESHCCFPQGYYSQRAFLATQGPLQGTTSDFWEMVWGQRSVAIVSLTQLEEEGQVGGTQH